ncbi:MAG: DNA primase [Proteobacteria bacterium]|nr:DNA primase [Pseudomonadota bacterium]
MSTRSGFISQEQKEQILKANDIVQLINDYVLLKPSGKNFLGLCPFHQEKTPSFTVSPSYQNFKCYGCGESGDSIRFVMSIENLQFVEAVRFLAKRGGIRLEQSSNQTEFKPVKSNIDQCLNHSFNFFKGNLQSASEASEIKKYLSERGISNDLVSAFQLGYVAPGWQNLSQYLSKKSISIEIQENAGLIKKGDKGNTYDRMRNRLIFPIRDKRGRLLGFAGRSIGDDEPKYLNPPETDLYKKSYVFYGIDKAVNDIRRKRRAILVEGYLDVIRLHEQGWQESIATCGTAVTGEHINNLKICGAEEVILLFDGDKAGIKAADRSARLFIENGLDSKVVVLPEGLDPDDYFKKYTNQDFSNLVEKAAYDFEFIISIITNQFKGVSQSENLIKEILSYEQFIKSTTKRELFLNKVVELTKISKKNIQQLISKSDTKKTNQTTIQEETTLFKFDKEYLHEIQFLQYLMNHVQAITLAREKVKPEEFIHQKLSHVYARFLQLSDEEFKTLEAKSFPDQFIEFNELLMHLLHFGTEYKGPSQPRPSTQEMENLKINHEQSISSFSELALNILIERLKKKRRSYDIKKLKLFPSGAEKSAVERLAENRKKNNP